jgi:hypothetical protein
MIRVIKIPEHLISPYNHYVNYTWSAKFDLDKGLYWLKINGVSQDWSSAYKIEDGNFSKDESATKMFFWYGRNADNKLVRLLLGE